PMFPQYASTTTASIYDAVNRAAAGRRCPLFLERKRDYPTLRFVPPYYADPGYIAALKAVFEEALAGELPPAHVLMSFHGNPQRYIDEGDPYAEQCAVTARQLAKALGLAEGAWSMAYQSKFGPGEWLQPATDAVLAALPDQGQRDVAVVCPGFTADCLETLDELGHEGREVFQAAGGATFNLVPCLNSHPAWVKALAKIVRRESAGWW
ncbi:MAG: ferrochelatase, partial [Anaerolineae bacterium]|nr:ferrochelatase [Anaerolineae bacterium]